MSSQSYMNARTRELIDITQCRDSTRMCDEAPSVPMAVKQSPGSSPNATPWSLGSSDASASGAPQAPLAGAASNAAAAAMRAARRPRLSWSARLQRASLERRARKMSAQYSFLDWHAVAELRERSRAQRLQASQVSAPVQPPSGTPTPKITHPIAPSRALHQVRLRPLVSAHQEPLPSIVTVNFKV